MRPEPVEGPEDGTPTESTRMDELQLSAEPPMRPEPLEAQDEEMRPEPVEGPEERTSTNSARISDEAGEQAAAGSARISNGSTNGASARSAHAADERGPDRNHIP
jgi:hypothetical protein